MRESESPEEWVLRYLAENVEASAVNEDFHERFHKRFPEYKRKGTMWGSQPVAKAQRVLRGLHVSGQVRRRRVSLSPRPPGFPTAVLSYFLE